MDTAKLLLALSELTGVSGREGEAAAFASRILEPYGSPWVTPLGSLVCPVRAPEPGQPHLLLDAHLDEIGMVVTFIEDSGFLRVAACGGVDRRLLAASVVTIHGAQGPVTGIVCSTPPHLSTNADKKNKKVEDIYIDIGCDGPAARKQVAPGDLVTLRSVPREMPGGQVSGKALDDRAGCVSILYALEQMDLSRLGCGLTVLFSSMEEVGSQGARTAAYMVEPTHAVAVDVSFAYTPDEKREQCGELKKGPMIGFSPVLSGSMSRWLVSLAGEQGIPWQPEVMGGKTGTNADCIAVSRGGVITGLLSIPLKYMHTPVETVAVEDVENTGRLLAACAMSLREGGKS